MPIPSPATTTGEKSFTANPNLLAMMIAGSRGTPNRGRLGTRTIRGATDTLSSSLPSLVTAIASRGVTGTSSRSPKSRGTRTNAAGRRRLCPSPFGGAPRLHLRNGAPHLLLLGVAPILRPRKLAPSPLTPRGPARRIGADQGLQHPAGGPRVFALESGRRLEPAHGDRKSRRGGAAIAAGHGLTSAPAPALALVPVPVPAHALAPLPAPEAVPGLVPFLDPALDLGLAPSLPSPGLSVPRQVTS